MKDEKPNCPGRISIDRKEFDWDEECITGLQIKNLVGIDVETYNAWQNVPGPEDIQIDDGVKVDLTELGVKKFFTGKKTSTEG